MSRLRDLVSQAVEETEQGDGRRAWVDAAVLVVQRADENDRGLLAHEGAKLLCKRAAERQGSAAKQVSAEMFQASLFPDLRRGYAINDETGMIKLTDSLSKIEFRRVIAVREKKIDEDMAHLKKLRDAYAAALPLWDRHPDWLFGQCCAELAATRKAS